MVPSVVVVVLVADSLAAVACAVVGTCCIGVSLLRSDQRVATFGSTLLFGSVVATAQDPLWLLLGTVPVVLAWGTASTAIRLGRQVGRTAETLRVELVHGAATVTVVTLAGGVGYLGYRSVPGTDSPLAVALLLGSVLVAVLVLR